MKAMDRAMTVTAHPHAAVQPRIGIETLTKTPQPMRPTRNQMMKLERQIAPAQLAI